VLRVLLAAVDKQNQKLCDLNAQDYIGWTPMHYAVEKRHKRAVKTLVESNANPEVEDTMQKNPYQYALEYRWMEIAEILRPFVKNAQTYDKQSTILPNSKAADDAKKIMEGVVDVRIPPASKPEDIPPPRKSGRPRIVCFM